MRHRPQGTLGFYLWDNGETMKKWDGKPSSVPVSQNCALKNAAPVSSAKLPKKSRSTGTASDPPEETFKASVQDAGDSNWDYTATVFSQV